MSWSSLATLVWPRNRCTPLVAFMLDRQDRLIGRIDNPTATLDPPELQAILLHLARECDRLESSSPEGTSNEWTGIAAQTAIAPLFQLGLCA